MKALDILREGGFRVKTVHFRYYPDRKHPVPRTSLTPYETFHVEAKANGGFTRVLVLSPSGHWAEAEARCASDEAFCKWDGTAIALHRALVKFTPMMLSSGIQMVIDRAVVAEQAESSNRLLVKDELRIARNMHHEEDAVRYADARRIAAAQKENGSTTREVRVNLAKRRQHATRDSTYGE